MGYIIGTGNLVVDYSTAQSDLDYKYKDITTTSTLGVNEASLLGRGVKYITGQLLSYVCRLSVLNLICSGFGKVDNLYSIPKIRLIGKFRIQPITREARFKVGRGN